MTVTISRFHLTRGEGVVKAFASVEIGGVVVIHGVRLLDGKNGLWAAMPQTQSKKDNKWYDVVQLLDRDVKRQIGHALINRYASGTTVAADGRREDTEDTPY